MDNSNKMSKAEYSDGILDRHAEQLPWDTIYSSDRWKTIYNTSYNGSASRRNENDIGNLHTNLNGEMRGLVNNCKKACEHDYGESVDSFSSLKGINLLRSQEGIPIQQIANNSGNFTGYGSVDSGKCKWFVQSENSPSWQTTYQNQFPIRNTEVSAKIDIIKSPAQYHLEQVFRHMRMKRSNM